MPLNSYDTLDYPWPNFKKRFGRFLPKAVEAAEMVRGAANYQPYLLGFPKPGQDSIPARGYWQGRAKLSPKSFIVAISGTSDEAAGFSLQIKDLGTGRTLFSAPMNFQNCTAQPSGSPQNQYFMLTEPHLCKSPSLVEVQITNLATVANRVQVCLHTAQPNFDVVIIE